jgi:hypothetical protein
MISGKDKRAPSWYPIEQDPKLSGSNLQVGPPLLEVSKRAVAELQALLCSALLYSTLLACLSVCLSLPITNGM